MSIKDITPTSPQDTDNVSAGAGSIRNISADIVESFPAFATATGTDDVCNKTGAEIDAGIDLAETAVQLFGTDTTERGPTGGRITPAANDYTVAQIDDSDVTYPVTTTERNFISDADKEKLDTVETGANNLSAFGDLSDVNVTGAAEGDILRLNGSGDWVDTSPGAIMPKVEMYRCREAATPSGPNKYQPYFTAVDENTVSTLGTVANSSTDGWKFTAAAGKTVEVSISANLGFGSGTLILALVSGGDRTVSIANFNAASITPRVYAYQQNSSAVGHLSSTFLLTDGEEVMLHSNSTTHQGTAGARSSRIVMMLREVLT